MLRLLKAPAFGGTGTSFSLLGVVDTARPPEPVPLTWKVGEGPWDVARADVGIMVAAAPPRADGNGGGPCRGDGSPRAEFIMVAPRLRKWLAGRL
mmetsp:Transcript_6660/g.20701  ORF Transcript_6660/g.20701 Transcript_6660/m.20701 type:complete len:95 (+) Transcript_6660:122-406(+)